MIELLGVWSSAGDLRALTGLWALYVDSISQVLTESLTSKASFENASVNKIIPVIILWDLPLSQGERQTSGTHTGQAVVSSLTPTHKAVLRNRIS